MEFLPTTKEELNRLGWDRPDVIIVSGDTYIDTPYDGAAVIGRTLADAGYRTAIIAQPDVNSPEDITRLGEPALFWGVTGGCVDSMVANYTALKKKRMHDDLTPGGVNDRRPDRAVSAYVNLIRRFFKNTAPIVIGGVEASLRRIAHYDFWDNAVRRPILFDSKADLLVYGMGEKTVVQLAGALRNREDYKSIKGLAYISKTPPEGYLVLPSFEEVKSDSGKFTEMFEIFYRNNDPLSTVGLVQKNGDRYCVVNPPQDSLTSGELDKVYELGYRRDVHPWYKKQGEVRAIETVRFSVTSHRGCYGECNFCSIAVHQGRRIVSRSRRSIVREVEAMAGHKHFKGIISDVGGPTANMYGNSCPVMDKNGACRNKRCAFPEKCSNMNIDHLPSIDLLRELRKIEGVKKVFVGSGVRYDLVIADDASGRRYLRDIVENHVSGQMKIAPEHTDDQVLKLMGKPSNRSLTEFKKQFDNMTAKAGKKQYLTYYFIAAYPGCDMDRMKELNRFIRKELRLSPEQVQVFTPTPSTWATLMYYSGRDPFAGNEIFVEKDKLNRQRQKDCIL